MTEYFNRKSTTSRRRELRQNLTKAEVLLWSILKGRKLEGCKFRRQFGIGEYVIDFFCAELNLGVEVDGESHYTEEGRAHDKRRKRFLDSLAIKIVRVTNPDVYDNLNGVWEFLRKTVLELKASQSKKPQARLAPPLTKGGAGGVRFAHRCCLDEKVRDADSANSEFHSDRPSNHPSPPS